MRRSRRTVIVSAVVVLAGALVGPPVVASRYTDGPGGREGVTARPDKGWHFIVDAVVQSRNAQLGSRESAQERAHDVWAGVHMNRRASAPRDGLAARAQTVSLVWTGGPFTVPVPRDGTSPRPGNEIATPTSPFAWMVHGTVGAGPKQMIGMLDYASGRVTWDIRSR